MKPNRLLTCFLVLLALSFIFVFCAVKGGALDFWMHLAAGRHIIEHQGFPPTDPFTYTAADSPWINGWWLSQVIFYLLYQWPGPVGLIFLKAFLLTALWGLLLKLALDAGIELYLSLPLVLLGALAGQSAWGLKPHFFTFFLFTFTYYILTKYRRSDSPVGIADAASGKMPASAPDRTTGGWFNNIHLPWLLLPLFAFWANLHPGWPAGLLLIALFSLEQGQKNLSFISGGKNLWQTLLPLGLFAAAAVLACAFTPFGIKGFWQPFSHIQEIGQLKLQGEWASPYFSHPAFYPFEFLLLLFLALLALGPYRPGIFELASLLIFGHMALQSYRHIPFFAVVAILPLGKALMSLTVEKPRRRRWTRGVLIIAVLFFIFSSPVWQEAKKAVFHWELFPDAHYVPARAVKILRHSPITGPFFSTYSWNGYEIWALKDNYKFFIDGRTFLYSPQIINDYLHIQEAGYSWEATLQRYGVNVILVDNGLPLARLLALSPRWEKVYEDQMSAVYRRITPVVRGS